MNHHIKRFLFKYYAIISVAVFIIVAILFFRPGSKEEWQAFATVEAAVLTFAYSVQKQQLEETRLFKELFEQFNARHDALNEDMNQIDQQPQDLPLKDGEIKTLFKYFNLCGEEWLYVKKGFICEEVWKSWENGMKFFRRKNPRIKKLWDKDLKYDAYYGLHFEDANHDESSEASL
jgi:hypothetical protein